MDDDLKGILEKSKNFFDQLDTGLDYLCCTTTKEFHEKINEHITDVKALIFDLVAPHEEGIDLTNSQTEFVKELYTVYTNLRVPIFIYSAHLAGFEGFQESGTVYKIDKGSGEFETIANQIKLLNESGFLDLFSFRGVIESEIMSDLHAAFTNQFKNNEIVEIIQAINAISGIDHQAIIRETFKRVAVRSLMSRMMIDKAQEEDKFNNVKISAVEHYIRRTNRSLFPIWTGDIFSEAKDSSKKVLVLTPRCDVATKGKENLLVGQIEASPTISTKNLESDLKNHMNDNILAKKFRHLPHTPIFEGGKVDLSQQQILSSKQLNDDYKYVISLSDDLTNEILGKFAAYLLRTGIPETDLETLKSFYLKKGE